MNMIFCDSAIPKKKNVNGIRAVVGKGDLQKYLKDASPDIICFNETKIDLENY